MRARGVSCGVMEWIKRNTVRRYGRVRRKWENRIARRMYQSSTVQWVHWEDVDHCHVRERWNSTYTGETVSAGVREEGGGKKMMRNLKVLLPWPSLQLGVH